MIRRAVETPLAQYIARCCAAQPQTHYIIVHAVIQKASDSATVAATESHRSGRSDFVKAFIDQIEKVVRLSKQRRTSDNTFASLLNCALDLDVDTLLDGDYKHLRQRERMKESGAKERP